MGITLPEMLTDYEGRTGGLSLQDLGLIMSALHIRNRTIYISQETYRYARAIAAALSQHNDANMTPDQVIDNYARRSMTEEFPQLVETHAEIEAIEEKMAELIQSRQ